MNVPIRELSKLVLLLLAVSLCTDSSSLRHSEPSPGVQQIRRNRFYNMKAKGAMYGQAWDSVATSLRLYRGGQGEEIVMQVGQYARSTSMRSDFTLPREDREDHLT